MRVVCWQGANKVRVETVPDPQIINPRDAVIKITTTAICGSDLHLYDGFISTMEQGDILGHEFMGEVVEVGSECDWTKPFLYVPTNSDMLIISTSSTHRDSLTARLGVA